MDFKITFDYSVTDVWRLRRDTDVPERLTVPINHILEITLPGGTGDLFNYDGNFKMH